MKPFKWIAISLLLLLATGSFNPLLAVSEQRQAYDKMVEEATREADEYVQEKQKQTKEASEKSQKKKDAAVDNRVQAERDRITAEMNKVQQRGMGPDFTQGMKDNQLKQLQDRLDDLNSDPEAYFEGQ